MFKEIIGLYKRNETMILYSVVIFLVVFIAFGIKKTAVEAFKKVNNKTYRFGRR
jgi:hypothetical protein